MKNNYIDNKEFYRAMVEYKESLARAKELRMNDTPKVPEYIGKCILLIAKNLASKGNFSGYSYIDEMQDDGIENCIKYINNFDHTKYKNPFAYFTTIMYYAFVRRINIEKKEQYVKYKVLKHFLITSNLENPNLKGDTPNIDNDITDNIIRNYEEFIQKKKDVQKSNAELLLEKSEIENESERSRTASTTDH